MAYWGGPRYGCTGTLHQWFVTRNSNLWTHSTNMDWYYLAWMGNHMSNKVWDGITYTFPNCNCCTVKVLELISNFILNVVMDVITYPCCPWWQYQCFVVIQWHGPLRFFAYTTTQKLSWHKKLFERSSSCSFAKATQCFHPFWMKIWLCKTALWTPFFSPLELTLDFENHTHSYWTLQGRSKTAARDRVW